MEAMNEAALAVLPLVNLVLIILAFAKLAIMGLVLRKVNRLVAHGVLEVKKLRDANAKVLKFVQSSNGQTEEVEVKNGD
jgi:hypothetical protein